MASASAYRFHEYALTEFQEAADYYLKRAGLIVAERFVDEIEAAIAAVLAAPESWRVIVQPGIRRYVVHHFPYVLYYRWESPQQQVVIYAVMHMSRRPGYWKERVPRQ